MALIYKRELCYKIFKGQNAPCNNCKNPQLINKDGQQTGEIVWKGFNILNHRWNTNSDRAIRWIDNRLVHIQIAFDITNAKEMEQKQREAELQLRQSQKMEAIGKLAGGVAHDLNNILSGIINYPELILLDLPKEHKLRRLIINIQTAGERLILDMIMALGISGLETYRCILKINPGQRVLIASGYSESEEVRQEPSR